MIENDEDLRTGDDSSSYLGSIVIGLVLAALYYASRGWLSEIASFRIAVTVLLLYVVTGPFRTHWREPKFWIVVVVLFGGHIALLWYLGPYLRAWSFWSFVKLAPEGLALILIIGWILGDNYFTRNTRRERARAAAQEEQGGKTGGTRRAERAGGLDQCSTREKDS